MTTVVHHRRLPWVDPLQALAAFAERPGTLLFDSAANGVDEGTKTTGWSFLCIDPLVTLEGRDRLLVDGRAVAGDPFTLMKREMARLGRSKPDPTLPPFSGGIAGMLGYEAGRHLERLPAPAPADHDLPEFHAGLYDTVICFDHQKHQTVLVARDIGTDPARPSARGRIARLADQLQALPPLAKVDDRPTAKWRAELTREAYEARVRRIIEYIHAGDIFQANLTQRFLADRPAALDALTLYRRLRARSPAPHAAYYRMTSDHVLASASPERFLKLDARGAIETRPIKGTRPRAVTASEDQALADELLASTKDRAENLMIVDLLRNDLGRVAEIGSVEVPVLCGLETFETVHHLVSVVRAQLRSGLGPVDLLAAAFPGGSITGAPKIRAMEIIREVEPTPRGPYCGSLFWIGVDGAMDSSILIRTLVVAGDLILAQAGGGIVADSDPAAEYEESLVKVSALLASVEDKEAAA